MTRTNEELLEHLERMDGVVTIRMKMIFQLATGYIIKELEEEGFDKEDVLLYLNHLSTQTKLTELTKGTSF